MRTVLYGQQASWKEVAQRLLDNTCPNRMKRTVAGRGAHLTKHSHRSNGPEHHPTPLSGDDRKPLGKELGNS